MGRCVAAMKCVQYLRHLIVLCHRIGDAHGCVQATQRRAENCPADSNGNRNHQAEADAAEKGVAQKEGHITDGSA